MAGNTGKAHRKGAVNNRSQTKNDKTGLYIKRDTKTGRFMSAKKTPYKGIKKEGKAKNSDKK